MIRALRDLKLPRLFVAGQTTPVRRRVSVLQARSWGTDRAGRLLWAEPWRTNILHDQGEQYVLSAAFDTDLSGYGAPPANLYLGLSKRAALAEDDTLGMTGFNEPSGNGYARQAISTTTGFTLSQPSDSYQAASATKTFTASGGSIGPVTERFLTTASSGTSGLLICSLALSTSRTMADGDSLNTTLIVRLTEPA